MCSKPTEDSAAIADTLPVAGSIPPSSRLLQTGRVVDVLGQIDAEDSSVSERTLPSSTMALDLADATADSASPIRAARFWRRGQPRDGFASIHIDSVRNGVRLVTPPTRTVHLSAPPPSPKYVDRYSTVSLPSVGAGPRRVVVGGVAIAKDFAKILGHAHAEAFAILRVGPLSHGRGHVDALGKRRMT